MLHEDVEDALNMLLVQDQQLVEALRANGAHESLRHPIRLRGAKRRANDLEPIAAKHFVKTVAECPVPVANQEAKRLFAFCQTPGQLSGSCVTDPQRARIRRAARNVHSRKSCS